MNHLLKLTNIAHSSNTSSESSEAPLYRGHRKKLNYLSSTLLENKDVRNTFFFSESKDMNFITNLSTYLDELLIVGKLYRGGTINTCNTDVPSPKLQISYSDWI